MNGSSFRFVCCCSVLAFTIYDVINRFGVIDAGAVHVGLVRHASPPLAGVFGSPRAGA